MSGIVPGITRDMTMNAKTLHKFEHVIKFSKNLQDLTSSGIFGNLIFVNSDFCKTI
jgi:hypothetical protein